MLRDPDIEKVEARIMRRRHDLTQATQAAGQRAMHALASPGALIGAAVFGFLAGGGIGGRSHPAHARQGRRRGDPASRAAKRTGVVGALMTGAMWLVRARFGSPAGLARYLMARRQQATSARQHGLRR
jgi:hypothetical protein